MRAAKYLGQVLHLDRAVNRKLAEKQQILDLVMRATPALSGMPRGTGGPQDRVGDAVARLVDMESEIDQAVDALVDAKAEVLRMLEDLPEDEQKVLHRYYVQGQTIEHIAEDFKPRARTPRQIYRIKARALKRVQALLDGESTADS